MLRRSSSLFLGTAMAVMLSLAPASAQEVIVSPDDELRSLIVTKLSGAVPNLEALARDSSAVRRADEFDRADALADEVARLNEIWAGLDEATALQFRLRTSLGEYDAAAGGFPLPLFDPGSYISGLVPVTFRNASAARIFPVPTERGREVLGGAVGSRGVTLTVTLDDLAASVFRSGAIEGRVAEVVVEGARGEELGRYSPEADGDTGSPDAATMDADAVAESIADTLGIPVAGTTWAEVLPFLQAQPYVLGTGGNFSGVLFSITSGELRTQRPLDEYRDLTLAFGPTDDAAQAAFRQGVRRSRGFGAPRPFGGLDCLTPGVADQCGILRFEKIGDVDVLVDAVTVAEMQGVRYDDAAALAPFDANAIAAMEVAETQVGYTLNELGGRGQQAVGTRLFWAGDLATTPMPLHDPRAGFSDRYSAKTMLWTIDGQSDRTVYVTRSSLP